jgi:hypothetical protein
MADALVDLSKKLYETLGNYIVLALRSLTLSGGGVISFSFFNLIMYA